MKICLCGSTKFKDDYIRINRMLSIMGHTVITVATFGHQTGEELTEDEKIKLDLVHLNKILMCDAILVVGVIPSGRTKGHAYIGDSTRREIAWARMQGKEVFFESEEDNFGPWHRDQRLKPIILPSVQTTIPSNK